MADKVEYRIVNQDRNVKVISRADVWVETRDAKRGPLDGNRVIQMYGTDESVDRHNTKLRVDGWDFKNYSKNPTFLWAHNNDLAVPMMPIGSVVKIAREEFERADVPGKIDKRLLFDIEFPQRGTYPFADLVCDMYKQNHLRASSVGFKPLEVRRLSADKDKEEMESEGYDLKAGFAAEFSKNELLELSAVPVGSNPNALQKALHAAVPDTVRALIEYTPDSGIDLDEDWVTKRLEAIRVALCAKEDPTVPGDVELTELEAADEVELTKVAADLTKELEEAHQLIDADPVVTVGPGGDVRFVKKNGNKYCVYTKEGKQIACHPTKEAADAQLAAIEANKNKESKKSIEELVLELTSEVRAMREELKQVRVAPPVAPAATPSHLDLILAENVESLERLDAIFKR